jgi:hypothetical protein
VNTAVPVPVMTGPPVAENEYVLFPSARLTTSNLDASVSTDRSNSNWMIGAIMNKF